jgi:hypothetical protein
MVLWNKEGKRSDWTVRTLVKLPDMVLFDLEAPNGNGWLSLVADEYRTGGNAKKIADIAEFSSALRVFREFQLARLIPRINKTNFRVSTPSAEPDSAGEFHLTATSEIDAYDITLTRDSLPLRISYESKLGLGSGRQAAYSGYFDAGKGKYPRVVVIKLPDAPQHGIELRFEKMATDTTLDEKDFKSYKRRR